jgi:hypothetical protein
MPPDGKGKLEREEVGRGTSRGECVGWRHPTHLVVTTKPRDVGGECVGWRRGGVTGRGVWWRLMQREECGDIDGHTPKQIVRSCRRALVGDPEGGIGSKVRRLRVCTESAWLSSQHASCLATHEMIVVPARCLCVWHGWCVWLGVCPWLVGWSALVCAFVCAFVCSLHKISTRERTDARSKRTGHKPNDETRPSVFVSWLVRVCPVTPVLG